MTDILRASSRDYDILRFPVFSEKSTMLLKNNAYVFVVDKDANKQDIKHAVESVFGVKVESVNTLVVKGKKKSFRGRLGRRSDYKKAIVRLKSGDSIELGIGVK